MSLRPALFFPLLMAAVCLAIGSAMSPPDCSAAPYDDEPKLTMTAVTTVDYPRCTRHIADCVGANTACLLRTQYDVYLLLSPGKYRSALSGGNDVGISRLDMGMEYAGKQGFPFINENEFCSGDFSGGLTSGFTILWDSGALCRRSPQIVIGHFRVLMYDACQLRLVPRSTDGLARITTCTGQVIDLDSKDLGILTFSSTLLKGFNPCRADGDLPSEQIRVTAAPPGGCPPAVGATASVPVTIDIQRQAILPSNVVHAYSVGVELHPDFVLDGPGITEGPFLQNTGTTAFIVAEGGGRYTVDCALLGASCASALTGTLFNVQVRRTHSTIGGDPFRLVSLKARDCSNHSLLILTDPLAPDPIADLDAEPLDSGSLPGLRALSVDYSAPVEAIHTEVYRAAFGDYPRYAAGAEPATPTYPPGPAWVLTPVDASGQADNPPTRDAWFYAAFTSDACGRMSTVSNLTAGIPNYLLGDVTDGVTPGAGDGRVNTADLSLLGAQYGVDPAPGSPEAALDVGPTLDGTTTARPVPDGHLDFEDLTLFSLNFGSTLATASPNRLAGRGASVITAATDPEPVELEASAPASAAAGETFDSEIRLHHARGLHAAALRVQYDPTRLRLLSISAGSFVRAAATPHVAWSPQPDRLDLALLGRGGALDGDGTLATVHFEALTAGPPAVGLADVRLRNQDNREIPARLTAPAPPGLALSWPAPNPFRAETVVNVSLPDGRPATLRVIDVQGRIVRTLWHGRLAAGESRLGWNGLDEQGRPAASGSYFLRLEAGDIQVTRTVQVLR